MLKVAIEKSGIEKLIERLSEAPNASKKDNGLKPLKTHINSIRKKSSTRATIKLTV